jgi:hypothetical protein
MQGPRALPGTSFRRSWTKRLQRTDVGRLADRVLEMACRNEDDTGQGWGIKLRHKFPGEPLRHWKRFREWFFCVRIRLTKIIICVTSAFACLFVLGMQHLGVHPVISSALVTFILTGLCLTLEIEGEFGPAIMCGSFVGMSFLPDLLSQPGRNLTSRTEVLFAILLSIGGGFVYLCTHALSERYSKMMLNGFGGKLGATAFLSTFLCATAVRPVLGLPCFPDRAWSGFIPHLRESLFSPITVFSIAMSVAGAVAPFLFQGKGLYQLTANGRVVVTALWGLCGACLLLLTPLHGGTLAVAWYTGSFVSMTAFEIISSLPYLMVAGAIAPMFLTVLRFPFQGFGGVLGMSALLSVIVAYHLEPFRLRFGNKFLPDRS